MRHKSIKHSRSPLNLSDALVVFGTLRTQHPEHAATVRLGMRLVREVQHLHKVIMEARRGLPQKYGDYVDPAMLDAALARTEVRDA